ncbi:iron complex outermembrane recepter protein [Collimonas sp. OK242]|uniref:TonB-dependent receptor n=1 Tax=Collimonas sp. OK242 TaxID=1798195 RepID=UPI00089D24AE|nr:TonB-dependent receptor [Collimonas sp. OK242]SDY53888.1 iron complex outermembrane recepter protein [Collimonas sp. OK242]
MFDLLAQSKSVSARGYRSHLLPPYLLHHSSRLSTALRPLPLSLMLALPVLSQGAWAAEDDTHAVHEVLHEVPHEVFVTGAREKRVLDPNLPASSERITAAQLENLNVVNTEDALKYMPNMAIRKRFVGDENATISVRGNGTSQTARGLVYADGLLLSNFMGNTHSFPPRWSMVFPEDMAQVDVIYGPFSALYPGNSMGATVAITTKMPTKLEAMAKAQVFSQQFNLFGVDGHFDGNKSTAAIGNKVGDLSFLLGVDHLSNAGQPFVYASQPRSTQAATAAAIPVSGAYSYTDPNGAPATIFGVNAEGAERAVQDLFKFKAVYDITPAAQAGFTFGYWRQQVSNSTRTFLRDAKGNPVYSGLVDIGGYQYQLPASFFAPAASESANQLYGLTLKTRNASGWNYSAIASYFDVSKSISRSASSGLASNLSGVATYGDGSGWKTLDLAADHKPATVKAGSHWLTFGYHYDNYFLENTTLNLSNWRSNDGGGFNNAFAGKTETQALFAQDAWQMRQLWKLTYGLRYEDWRAYDGVRAINAAAQRYSIGYDSRNLSYWSPKAALSYKASSDLTIRFSTGRAYRFPTVSELFQGSLTGSTLVNNDPNLKPENDLAQELSAEWSHFNGMLRMSLFEDDVKNTLFSQTSTTLFPNVTSIQNIDRVRSRGIELSYSAADVFLRGLDLSASAGYTRSIILENSKNPATVGKNFYRIPVWRSNLVGSYRIKDQANVMLAGRYSGRQYNTLTNTDINPDTFGGTSSFLVFDTKLTFKPTKHTELGIGIDNLSNRRYYVYYPYPGRTLYLEAKVSL